MNTKTAEAQQPEKKQAQKFEQPIISQPIGTPSEVQMRREQWVQEHSESVATHGVDARAGIELKSRR